MNSAPLHRVVHEGSLREGFQGHPVPDQEQRTIEP